MRNKKNRLSNGEHRPVSDIDTLSALRTSSVFSGLEDEQLKSLSSLLVRRNIDADTVIFQEGDTANRFYLLLDGRVKVMLADPEGREVIVSILHAGESFGEMAFFDSGGRSAQVVTMTPVQLLVLTGADFRGWISRNPNLVMAIIQQVTHRLRQANQTINSLATLDLKSRVARFLLEAAEGHPSGRVVDLPTQSDIAKMVGGSRERVNRALKDLEQQGFVRFDGEQFIVCGMPY
ncbi:MAG: Crp/Fnr family transcriptional regulator [Pseudomonadota bacterium]